MCASGPKPPVPMTRTATLPRSPGNQTKLVPWYAPEGGFSARIHPANETASSAMYAARGWKRFQSFWW